MRGKSSATFSETPISPELDVLVRADALAAALCAPHEDKMLIIEDQKHFDNVVAYAKEHGLYEPTDGSKQDSRRYLKDALDRLEGFTRMNEKGEIVSRVAIYADFAPHSFGFTVDARDRDGNWHASLVGGVIFHGAHDGGGNGGAPTYSVAITSATGWLIHT